MRNHAPLEGGGGGGGHTPPGNLHALRLLLVASGAQNAEK